MFYRSFSAVLLFAAVPVFAQQSGPVPIYHVTVTERTVKAINYQYRAEPTLIDFRGTVLLPKGKGLASVQSKQGRCEIDVNFENLAEPAQFGREYLTYVLWALTPDGRPLNLGEVVANGSNKAHLRVTTEAQAFAMIVTAEPYSAVRQPGDVVVLENQVRPDTIGKVEEVTARYELLPRGQYSWQIPDQLSSAAAQGPKVSMRKYEALLELYGAQNAVGIAGAAHAAEYAPNTFAKAQQLLAQAQQLNDHKGDNARIVETAREAAQAAEDSRLIAVRRQQEDQVAHAQSQIAAARQAQATAEQEVQRLRADAQAARAQADAERAAREQAEADAAEARGSAARHQPIAPPPPSAALIPPPAARQVNPDPARAALRMRLLDQMNGPLETRDTPRGLVAVVSNLMFAGGELRASANDQVSRIAAIIRAHPGLRVEVDGHSDSENDAPLASRRAEAVRTTLIHRGLSPNTVIARGLGNSRPLTSNATPAGRETNERVEIVISGDPIGSLPFWDKTYSLKPGSGQ